MSGFATAGLAAFESLKSKATEKLAEIKSRNLARGAGGGGGYGGYEEFEMPNEHTRDNRGFDDERGGIPKQHSLDSPLAPERPPLRHIDTYCMPEIPGLSKRYTIALLACIGFIISFGMRCNMSMAKLKSGNDSALAKQGNDEDDDSVAAFAKWDVATQSTVDSSFFWGYLVTQVPGGFLAQLYPANRIFGTAIVISCFLNLLAPGAINYSAALYILIQVTKGLVEGVTYPACHGIWKYWAPPMERSRLATMAFCGSYAAIVLGMPLSGILSDWLGWYASFYFYGVVGIIWYCVWLWLAFEKPSKHPCISARELRYIEDSLGQGQAAVPLPTFSTTPWKKFLTSMPVHAIIVANFCRSWNFYMLVLFQSRFMHEVYGMPIIETGLLGSIPHLIMTVIVPSGGLLADYLRKNGIMSTTNVRKLFNCGGFGMEALFFLVVANCTSDKSGGTATLALTIGVACSGFAISGFNVNHLDIAPRYASILMGMSNGVGTIAGLLVPIFVDNITRNKDPQSWRKVFVTAACVHFVGVTFYAIFCSGELQPWADPNADKDATWNPLDELGQQKPPVPPPPKVMQTQFIRQPSLGEQQNQSWDQQAQYQQQVPGYERPSDYGAVNQSRQQYQEYQQQEPIDRGQSINYGATESVAGNPFASASTNPFSTGATYVQPAARDDYSHDPVLEQQRQWQQ